MERLCQRFTLGRAEFADLVSIQNTIERWSDLQKRIKEEQFMEGVENAKKFNADDWRCLDALFNRMVDVGDLASKISSAIIIPSGPSCDMNDMDVENPQPTEDVITDAADLISDKPTGTKWTINPKSAHKIILISIIPNVCFRYSETTERLHTVLTDLLRQKEELQQELRAQYCVCFPDIDCSFFNDRIYKLLRR